MKAELLKSVEQKIEDNSFVIGNPNCPILLKSDALRILKEIIENERNKAVESFTNVLKEVLGAYYQSDIDMFKEKLEEKK